MENSNQIQNQNQNRKACEMSGRSARYLTQNCRSDHLNAVMLGSSEKRIQVEVLFPVGIDRLLLVFYPLVRNFGRLPHVQIERNHSHPKVMICTTCKGYPYP